MSLREERDTQTVYTGSLLNQVLHPVPRSHWQSTKQLKQITHKPPKNWPWTLQETHSRAHKTQEHTKNVDLNHLKSTQNSLATTPEFTEYSERITLVYRTIWNQYRCNLIPLSLDKTQSLMWMFKTWKQSFTTEKLKYVFLVLL